jgi:hypothetical protein
MDKIAQIEAELRQMEDVFARKSNALKKLQEAYRAKYAEMIDAKGERARWTAKQIVRAGAKLRGEVVDLPTDPVARAIIAAGRKCRGEIE